MDNEQHACRNYVMVNVSDMHRSVAFYRDTLGLRLKFESPGWSEFETGASTLALHAAPPPTGSEAATHAGPATGTCSLGFSVPDLNSTYREFRDRTLRDVPTEQTDEGIRLRFVSIRTAWPSRLRNRWHARQQARHDK